MARFGIQDVENYGKNSSSSFFQLKDDKDTERVRFMYNGAADISGLAVHKVEVDGKDRYVNCLREYNEPIGKCPFCEAKIKQEAKFFVPLYIPAKKEVAIWERGKKFAQKLASICARYSSADVPLVSHTFEIERNGKKGDDQTTYEVYECDRDDTRLEDLPEVDDVVGTLVLDKSADEMRAYLDNGVFPADGHSQRSDSSRNEQSRPSGRRRPADDDNF